jgi:hypothetical protein
MRSSMRRLFCRWCLLESLTPPQAQPRLSISTSQSMHMARMLCTYQSYTSSTAPLQGGCAVLAGVAVAAGGLPRDATAFWHDRCVSLRQLLGPVDARRLTPMFQQVMQRGFASVFGAQNQSVLVTSIGRDGDDAQCMIVRMKRLGVVLEALALRSRLGAAAENRPYAAHANPPRYDLTTSLSCHA